MIRLLLKEEMESHRQLLKTSDVLYLMENTEEAFRLEIKTDPEAVRQQALWCGVKPGQRVLDVGCGPGKTTSILHQMVQPGGSACGIDFSADRIDYAKTHYGQLPGIHFSACNFKEPLKGIGQFDLVWVRFVLEYFLAESQVIVENISHALKPGGVLCLLDLDYNCLSHYQLPPMIEKLLPKLMNATGRTIQLRHICWSKTLFIFIRSRLSGYPGKSCSAPLVFRRDKGR